MDGVGRDVPASSTQGRRRRSDSIASVLLVCKHDSGGEDPGDYGTELVTICEHHD